MDLTVFFVVEEEEEEEEELLDCTDYLLEKLDYCVDMEVILGSDAAEEMIEEGEIAEEDWVYFLEDELEDTGTCTFAIIIVSLYFACPGLSNSSTPLHTIHHTPQTATPCQRRSRGILTVILATVYTATNVPVAVDTRTSGIASTNTGIGETEA